MKKLFFAAMVCCSVLLFSSCENKNEQCWHVTYEEEGELWPTNEYHKATQSEIDKIVADHENTEGVTNVKATPTDADNPFCDLGGFLF